MAFVPWFDENATQAWEAGIFTSPWDIVLLGVNQLPGRSSLTLDRELQTTVNVVQGQDGANVRCTGAPPGKLVVTNTIWTRADHLVLVAFIQVLEPSLANFKKQKNSPAALALVHPLTALRGIQGMILTKIEGPNPGGTMGTLETKFIGVEWVKPLKFPSVEPKTIDSALGNKPLAAKAPSSTADITP